jgi:ubiquinone/menaquinone biosynthesis C-methylase UbiE
MNLQRTLEPEVMDSEKEAREYNDMDHSEVNRRFVEELLAYARSTEEQADDEELELGDVLDLGTGTALIPIELCLQHEHCRVMAVDMAVSMLELAVYNLEIKGMTERITLAQVDAKRMGYEDGMFDVVMSNSIVHHIPEPMECLSQMVRVTSDGGILFIRDLMRPAELETLEELVQTYAGKESEYSQKLIRDSLHAALSIEEIHAMVGSLGFDPESVQPSSDRHWTWAARKI